MCMYVYVSGFGRRTTNKCVEYILSVFIYYAAIWKNCTSGHIYVIQICLYKKNHFDLGDGY